MSIRACAIIALLLAPLATHAAWDDDFTPMGVHHTYGGQVFCMTGWNEKLAVGGYFETAGDVEAEHVAIWTGDTWTSPDGGLSGEPEFLLAYGSALLAGGMNTLHIAQWDGYGWSLLEGDGLGGTPHCACSHNGAIYVGGSFFTGLSTPPYTPMKYWEGGGWHPVILSGWDYTDDINTVHSFYGRIYMGGAFANDMIDPPDMTYNLLGWSADEGAVTFDEGVDGWVNKIVTEGAGVWIGGGHEHAGGVLSNGLAWMGPGGSYAATSDPTTSRYVVDMIDQSGILYVVERTGGYPYDYKVRSYNSGVWSSPLEGVFTDPIDCIGSAGPGRLYVGGRFDNGVVRWDDGEWVQLGGGIGRNGNQDSYFMLTLQAWDGGVVAGGYFDLPKVVEDSPLCEDVAFWNGDHWHRMGAGMGSVYVRDLAAYQGDLYAATQNAGLDGGRFFRWNGSDAWEAVGEINNQMRALTVHDGELILAGSFTQIDGTTVNRIAAWNGTSFRTLGDGFNSTVTSLCSMAGALYAAGNFTTADGADALRVACWNGSSWIALGDGLDAYVHALTAYDGDLIAGGSFTHSGTTEIARVARWDGTAWQPLGTGVDGSDMILGVSALRGTTGDLYVGGDFDTAGGNAASGLAVWDGAAWSEFEDGIHMDEGRPTVRDLAVIDGDLWVAGDFLEAGSQSSCNIARWTDGTLVPNLLGAFRLDRDGTAAAFAWSLAEEIADADLRLDAVSGATSWTVPFSRDGLDYTARDTDLPAGASIDYALKLRDDEGWSVLRTAGFETAAPCPLRLVDAAPNPFNPSIRIAFELAKPQSISLEIYDLAGRRMAVLAEGRMATGLVTRTWDGRDTAGAEAPSGTYLVRLSGEASTASRKIMLVR